jgi:hypothetical protein
MQDTLEVSIKLLSGSKSKKIITFSTNVESMGFDNKFVCELFGNP